MPDVPLEIAAAAALERRGLGTNEKPAGSLFKFGGHKDLFGGADRNVHRELIRGLSHSSAQPAGAPLAMAMTTP